LSARQVFPYSQKDVFAFMHSGWHCSVSAHGANFSVIAAHAALLSFSTPASKKKVSEKLPQ
jgi:hypothetical protein